MWFIGCDLLNEICNNLVMLPTQLYYEWFSPWRFCVYVSVHVCATYLLFLSCSKPITFQYSPSNFLDIITGLVYTGLYWGFEVIFLCVYFYAHVYVCMYMYICICVCIYKYIYYHILYVYVCVCLCMYVCMYVYVYMNIDVYIFRVRFSF